MSDPRTEVLLVHEPDTPRWGGDWTRQKIQIFLKYLKAYLEIMKSRPYFELIYFDGFAGSGRIEGATEEGESFLESVAVQVIGMDHPRKFDIYYLVDKNEKKIRQLKQALDNRFAGKGLKYYPVADDCNERLKSLSNYLAQDTKKRKALVFIDPFGMQADWQSLETLKGHGVDLWILVPTGIGVSRLLKKDGQITSEWKKKLERFLGMGEDEIIQKFYKEKVTSTLFGEERTLEKEEAAAEKIAELYREQLLAIWEHVTEAFPMKNSKGSIMYHFLMATNNPAGLKIANDIIGKEMNS